MPTQNSSLANDYPMPYLDGLLGISQVAQSDSILITDLPSELRDHDVLTLAYAEGHAEIVLPAPFAKDARRFQDQDWVDYREWPHTQDLPDALRLNKDVRLLWVRMTAPGMALCAKHRLALVEQGHDRMPLAIAAKRYHVTAKTLRSAVKDKRLTDYRPPGAAMNAPMIVSGREVANFYPLRG